VDSARIVAGHPDRQQLRCPLRGNGGSQEKKTYVFKNPFWEFKLQFVRDKKGKAFLTGTLANITHQRQKPGHRLSACKRPGRPTTASPSWKRGGFRASR